MEEDSVIQTLTGFDLDNVLTSLSLPAGSVSNQLGISGVPELDRGQIYNDNWDDGAVGAGEGDDWEDEVDRELQAEGDLDAPPVKMELDSPGVKPKQKRIRTIRRLIERPKTVYERFPDFHQGKVLDFTELFKGKTVQKSRLTKRPFSVESFYARRKELPHKFLDAVAGDMKRQVEAKRVDEVVSLGNIDADLRRALQDRDDGVDARIPLHDRSFDLVLLSNWEDQLVTEPRTATVNTAPPVSSELALTTAANKTLESGIWTQSIIWEPRAPFRDFTQIEFNHEDDVVPEERTTETVRPRKRMRFDATQVRDKFNMSNDHLYEVSKDGGRHRVRQTFGQIAVEHAYPAQKLQLPFYKTRLSKQEARSFHRPALQFPANIELRFSKVRTAKKKKDKSGRKLGKGGNVGESLRRTTDLTLKDTSNFVLWEYSEEHPPIIQNFGMASSLVNYYRKKDEKDEHIPKYDLGVPFILEPQDDSPFMKFGYVYPGQTIPALYNNLIRAPLFRHKPYSTDFLVIRSTIKGDSKYYLREIKNLFVIGQTYPVTEVPGPHSRKITNTIKYRLQTIAYKLLAKSPGERLKISRLMKYFPDQNELQMRQRLKEFMEYHRRGPHQGFWRLKPNWVVPSEAEQLKLVGPEQVVLAESMQVGMRHLQDAGYTQTAETDNGDESHLSIEQQLAPWITTKNFLYATQAKAMLRLHGEGDPSGRGEAFSFIRISMKDIFVKAGEDYDAKMAEVENRPKSAHRYNVAEQQQIYKSEIERIWKAQFDSLSRKEPPQLTPEEESRGKKPPSPPLLVTSRKDLQHSHAPSPGPNGTSTANDSRGSSMDPNAEQEAKDRNRVLRIKRLIDGEWQTEIIREPAVIRAYIRGRQIIEEEATMADSLAPTGDADKDKRAKKRLEEEIARMKKNQERRLHRKNAKIVKEGGTPLQLNRPIKPDTTRRCGHCGQMGHMKTNRKCPRYAEFNGVNVPPTPSMTSPTTLSGAPSSANLGFARSTATHMPSPLATSPPTAPVDLEEPQASGSKLKLTLKKH